MSKDDVDRIDRLIVQASKQLKKAKFHGFDETAENIQKQLDELLDLRNDFKDY